MRFSLFRRKPEPPPLTIEQALAATRPDLAVAEWLQLRGWGLAPMPDEVNAAHFTDFFLSSICMSGVANLIDAGDWLNEISTALQTVGLTESGAEFDALRNLDPEAREARADAFDDKVSTQAAHIEQTNHDYIRRNLNIFKSVD